MISRLGQRFGRRGALLGLYGLIWLVIGLALMSTPTRFGNLGPVITAVNESPWPGAGWMACGATAIVMALHPRSVADGAGFVALLLPPLVWTAGYGISWVLGLATANVYGSGHSWYGALVWVSEVVMVLITAGWPDPALTPAVSSE